MTEVWLCAYMLATLAFYYFAIIPIQQRNKKFDTPTVLIAVAFWPVLVLFMFMLVGLTVDPREALTNYKNKLKQKEIEKLKAKISRLDDL